MSYSFSFLGLNGYFFERGAKRLHNYNLSELLSKDVLDRILSKSHRKLNDLDRHVIGYIAACAAYDAYIKRIGLADYISGYSMGIFGVLYASRSISFRIHSRLEDITR